MGYLQVCWDFLLTVVLPAWAVFCIGWAIVRCKRPDDWPAPGHIHANHLDRPVKCPECGWVGTEEDLDDTWDWAGPHCPSCGLTGGAMLSAVGIPKSSRAFINEVEDALKEIKPVTRQGGSGLQRLRRRSE